MKQLSLTLLLSMVSMLSFALDFTVDSIKYSTVPEQDGCVKIVGYIHPKPIHLVIPDVVSYNNVEYKVTAVEREKIGYSDKAFESVKFGANVTSIGEMAFLNQNIEEIDWGSADIKEIGARAFSSNKITSLVIPESVEIIGSQAFAYNKYLEKVTSNISELGNDYYAFLGCTALKTVILGDKTTKIHELTFSGCSNIEEVYVFSPTPPTYPGWDFDRSKVKIYVPSNPEVYSLYQAASPWKYHTLEPYITNKVELHKEYRINFSVTLTEEDTEATYQWYGGGYGTKGEPIEGETGTSIDFSKVEDMGILYCVVTTKDGWQIVSDKVHPIYGELFKTQVYEGNNNAPTMELPFGGDVVNWIQRPNCFAFMDATVAGDHSTVVSNLVFKSDEGEWEANKIELTDAKPMYSPSPVKTNNITYTRTFTSASWQPLYIPFAVENDANLQAIGKVAYINNVHQYDAELNQNSKTVIEYITVPAGAKLKPNRTYVIKPNADKLNTPVEISADNAVLEATANNSITCSSTTTNYTFTGNYYTKNDMATSGAYALTANGFFKATSNAQTLSPFRFFLTVQDTDTAYDGVSSANAPKHISIMVDGVIDNDDATGIENATEEALGSSQTSGYNIAGQKVSEGYKGIVIKNGRKMLVK